MTKDGRSDEYRHIGSGAGLGLLGVPLLSGLWQPMAAASALTSLVMLGLYWHPWLVVSALLDVAVLAALVWPGWATR